MSEQVMLRIQRQDSATAIDTRRFEDFVLTVEPDDSIATLLFSVMQNPRAADGRQVAPVAFESACRASGCGACTLLINGHVRVACRTRVSSVRPKRGPIVLAPLSKFPLVRDLIVDRTSLGRARRRVGAWLDDPPSGSHVPVALSELDRCVECGACFEACPEAGGGRFVGAAALNEARLANAFAAGAGQKSARLDALMAAGGIAGCGKAQVCVAVCPERMPLFDSILELGHETSRRWRATLLRR